MDRFVSHFINRLDAKGRVSIPASFRAVLARDGHEGLYVYSSPYTKALDCGGNALLRELDELADSVPTNTEDRDALHMALFGDSQVLRIDGEGRVVLSDEMKEHTGITTEATFVGVGQNKFQIWEPSRFQAQREEAKSRLRELRKRLGSGPAATAAPPQPPGARD